MEKIADTKIGKIIPKKGFKYPFLRFPKELDDLIDKTVNIFLVNYENERVFMIKYTDNSPLVSEKELITETTFKKIAPKQGYVAPYVHFLWNTKARDRKTSVHLQSGRWILCGIGK
jgi:hypothetical protein